MVVRFLLCACNAFRLLPLVARLGTWNAGSCFKISVGSLLLFMTVASWSLLVATLRYSSSILSSLAVFWRLWFGPTLRSSCCSGHSRLSYWPPILPSELDFQCKGDTALSFFLKFPSILSRVSILVVLCQLVPVAAFFVFCLPCCPSCMLNYLPVFFASQLYFRSSSVIIGASGRAPSSSTRTRQLIMVNAALFLTRKFCI